MAGDGNVDIEELQAVVMKLLDKAGTDARLTPRLLRQKVEQRMKLEQDALKDMKSEIMTMIVSWWTEKYPVKLKKPQPTESDLLVLVSLSEFAKAVGKGPHFFKSNFETHAEKSGDIRKRLQDEGYEVPDMPSEEEIEEAKRKYDLTKETADIDTSVMISHGRRAAEAANNVSDDDKLLIKSTAEEDLVKNSTTTKATAASPQITGETASATKKRKLSDDAEDEEEEAEF